MQLPEEMHKALIECTGTDYVTVVEVFNAQTTRLQMWEFFDGRMAQIKDVLKICDDEKVCDCIDTDTHKETGDQYLYVEFDIDGRQVSPKATLSILREVYSDTAYPVHLDEKTNAFVVDRRSNPAASLK